MATKKNEVIETTETIPQKTKGKPRGGNSPVIGNNGIKTTAEDNSRYAGILVEIIKWGAVDKSDVQALEDRFTNFIEYCGLNGIRVTNQLTYLALGISKDDVYNWENGRSMTQEHSEFIKKVKGFCASYREMLGADGKLNPITLVWWQKNYDGLVDKSEVILTPNSPFGNAKTPEQIAERYESAMGDYTEEG